MNRLPVYIANRCYDILVEFAGAPEGDRDSFLYYYCRDTQPGTPTEFRCCGKFGFAGKFWWNNDRFYVSGHSRGDRVSEDFLEEERKEIEPINRLLAEAYAEFERYREREGMLSAIPAFPQHQGAVNDQLQLLVPVANKLGLQDAADCIQRLLDTSRSLHRD